LHWSTLGEERKAILRLIVDQMPLQGSYLAGGTALALIIGHRESIDFDWFSPSEFDLEGLARRLSLLKPFTINEATRGTLHGIMDNVRVSWFYNTYYFTSDQASLPINQTFLRSDLASNINFIFGPVAD